MNNRVLRANLHYSGEKISAVHVTEELGVRLTGGKTLVDGDDSIVLC